MWVLGEVEPIEGFDYEELLTYEEPDKAHQIVAKVEVKQEQYRSEVCYRAEIKNGEIRISPARVSNTKEAAVSRLLAYVADMASIFPEKWVHRWYARWAQQRAGKIPWQMQCVGCNDRLYWRTIHIGDGAKISPWYRDEVDAIKAAMYESLLESGVRLKFERLGIIGVSGPPVRTDVTWTKVYDKVEQWKAQYSVDVRLIGEYYWEAVVQRVNARYSTRSGYEMERRYVENLEVTYVKHKFESSIGILALEGAIEQVDNLATSMTRYCEDVTHECVRKYLYQQIHITIPQIIYAPARQGQEHEAHPIHSKKCEKSIIMRYDDFRRGNGWDKEVVSDFRELCQLISRDVDSYPVIPYVKVSVDDVEGGDNVLFMLGIMMLSKTVKDVVRCVRNGGILLTRTEVEALGITALQQCVKD